MIDAFEIKEIRGTEEDAREAYEALSLLPNYIGGRYFTRDHKEWLVLAYFIEDGSRSRDGMPEGCRLVEMPECLAPWYGIRLYDEEEAEDKEGESWQNG